MQKKSDKYGKILIVDDDREVLRAARIFLKRHFRRVDVESKPTLIPDLLAKNQYDVVLLDMNFTRESLSGKEGFSWLQRILEIDADVAVILITAYGDVEKAVQAIKRGAVDFIQKPWDNQKLLATIVSAIKKRQSTLEKTPLSPYPTSAVHQKFPEIIGASPAMLPVFAMIEKVADTEANILVLGENGVGKELVAKAIHRLSSRAKAPFVSVDLGAVPESLLESELFGHKKGAFTDAWKDKPGRFEQASGGVLFLDEIGNLSIRSQVKLLSVLQNRRLTRLGAHRSTPVDIRLISATNQALEEMIANKTFRRDLLYRINTIEIKLPPLRERKSDIPLLVQHFIEVYNKKYQKEIRGLEESVMDNLQSHSWPGNVRELQHAVERAVIMSTGYYLSLEDFFFQAAVPKSTEKINPGWEGLQLEEVERLLIRKALKKHSGNISQAAKELGLTRASLYRRMEKYGL